MKKETNALQVIAGAARCPEYSPPMVLNLMKKLNMNERAFALVMNVTPSTIRLWTSGAAQPCGTARRLMQMVNTLFSLPGYIHLYRSLLRFCDMPENEIKEMLCQLNSANLDCFAYYHPDFHVYESGPVRFSMELDRLDKRPYRTEVQLYKSLLTLKRGIDRELIITAQREALQTLRCILSNIEYRFYKAYGMEIEDKRTVYGECLYRLIPSDCEPSVCLMNDWICLPSA